MLEEDSVLFKEMSHFKTNGLWVVFLPKQPHVEPTLAFIRATALNLYPLRPFSLSLSLSLVLFLHLNELVLSMSVPSSDCKHNRTLLLSSRPSSHLFSGVQDG